MASHLPGRLAIPLALATMLSHSLAHASASASASIGPVQYTLTDLNPNDGIAPSITWGVGQLTQRMSVSPSNGVADGGGPNAIDHFEKSVTSPPSDSLSTLSYQGFSVAAGADGLNTSASIPVGASWWQANVLSKDFVLSANTAITFTAQASASLEVMVPPGSVVVTPSGYVSNGYFDWAPIQARSLASLYLGTGALASLSSTSPSCSTGCLANDSAFSYLRSYATDSRSQSRLLSLTFTNSTQGELGSTLSSIAVSDGYATAPLALAVPELSSMAQMSMGLVGLVGLLATRRKHLKAP
jgi:hypothetical protein